MNEQQLAAVKQAMEALRGLASDTGKFENEVPAITALQSIISQDALDKKAENARELGLSYDPAHDIVDIADIIAGELKVSRGTAYDMMREALKEASPVEPVAWVTGFHAGRCVIQTTNPAAILPVGIALYTAPPAPQPVPVKTYHDGKPWPVAPKPWVGLTDKEVGAAYDFANANSQYGHHHFGFWLDSYRAIEAKLKEKNT